VGIASDVDQAEGTGSGSTTFAFTVVVHADPGCAVTGSVDFHTVDGDPSAAGATAPSDYAATSGTLTWSNSTDPQTVDVAVVPDAVSEPTEQFWLELDDPVGLAVTGGDATGGILNDDTPATASPTVSIDGTPKCWITCGIGVHVAGTTTKPLTVHWRTLDNGGQGLGYVPVRDAVLTIPAGATRGDVVVRLQPDTSGQPFRFGVQISQPSAGVLGNTKATVTVTDGQQ
jgi:hypothetical protein